MTLLYSFAATAQPQLGQVGGKALSLINMTQQGLPVPQGFVLTEDFFAPWMEGIQQTPEWAAALDSVPLALKPRCDAVKALCANLELDVDRAAALAQGMSALGGVLFAVRSSSPEEDLEGASFAGGYETVLGVTRDGILNAIRRSFASCFDERVLVYKREQGFDVTRPRIAVIVQQQVVAESSGVAFSLNPINNCYDELVINANFGLGESVVSGAVSPDNYIINKVSRTILDRRAGKKETSIWVSNGGGTHERPAPDRGRLCLTDAQVLQLAELVMCLESHGGKPVDVEWAFASGQVYLLQARPITAYFPLPEALRTAPGAPKRLYCDMTLTKWGMQGLLSVLGIDHLEMASNAMLCDTIGSHRPETLCSLRAFTEGRAYLIFSNNIKLYGRKRAIESCRTQDAKGAAILEAMNLAEYTPAKMPPELKGVIPKALGKALRLMWRTLKAYRHPEEFSQRHLAEIERTLSDLQRMLGEAEDLPLGTFAHATIERMIAYVSTAFSPCFTAALFAKAKLERLFRSQPADVRGQLRYVERALPHNITIAMGLAMYQLSRFPEVAACATWDEMAARLQTATVSPEFRSAWDEFMERYGFRSPMEMDAAAPRFYEQPERLFDQVHALAQNTDSTNSPQAIHERAQAERERAYTTLHAVAERLGKARAFEKNYSVLVTFGGFRKTAKYLYVFTTDVFRRRALQIGCELAKVGRLERAEQVFGLSLADLERAQVDPSLDLLALAEKNTAYRRRYRHVRVFPALIDSRGRVFRVPQREAKPGELVGEAIAPGSVRGPARVLHTPTEKRVLPGDILVARATDPGWTPLFLNAAGIILEVGGVLQHGALVAREYGKPCVVGIDDATTVLQDGQIVELDGTNGIVRLAS